MTANFDDGYINGDRTNSQARAMFDKLVDIVQEIPGGSGFYASTVSLSADILQIVDNYPCYTVAVETGSADDLKAITSAGTLRNGQMVGIKIADAAKPITLKHNVAVPKKILTRDGADVVIRNTDEINWFQYDSVADAWNQRHVDRTARLNLMLGSKAIASLTPSSNVVTPTTAFFNITSGADVDVNQIDRTNFPDDVGLILVSGANATYARTLKHDTGGSVDGKMYHTDDLDVVLDNAEKWVLYYATTVGGYKCWQEITRFGFSSAGGWTTSAKSADYTVSSIVDKTRYLVDATSAVTHTFSAVSPQDGTTELEIVKTAGSAQISIAFTGDASAAANKVIDPLGSWDTYQMPDGSTKRVKLLAVTGGWMIS